MKNKKRSLLATCLLISVSLHLFLVAFLVKQPLVLQNRFTSLFRKSTPPLESVAANEEDLVRQEELEEVFEELASPDQKEIPFDLRFHPSDYYKQPSEEIIATLPPLPEAEITESESLQLPTMVAPSLAFVLASFDEMERVRDEETIFPQLSLEKRASSDPKNILTSSLVLEGVEEEDDLGFESMPTIAMAESTLPPASFMESFSKEPNAAAPQELKPALDASLFSSEKSEKETTLLLPQSPIITLGEGSMLGIPSRDSLPEVDAYLLPQIAQTQSWDEAFEVKMQLMPHPEGAGYVFSLSLNPTDELQLESQPQNYYFLIDRSSSIERHRFAAYKRAVIKALSCLQEGDKFNIILFDKKVRRLSESSLPFSRASISRAEEFLEGQEHGGMFASADLYSSLEKIIPRTLSDDEVHTAILLSDGGSSQATVRHQKSIGKWLEKNEGKVTLHSAAVGQGNNLIMLDLLSSCSGGQLLYSDTHAAFPRRLGKLLLDLRNPLITNMTVTAIPKDGSSKIHFYPTTSNMPTLFAKRPYDIVGTLNKFGDFTLLIQGKYKDQWVTITKEISLKDAAKAPRILEKRWAKVRAKEQYENFLREGKVAHLIKAKELLKSSGNDIAL
ncbi:MAG: VWA domain-containing protein [Chlamydiales bacterium]|nr:VWA domain-containing protein [Chlamydiales bacterium]